MGNRIMRNTPRTSTTGRGWITGSLLCLTLLVPLAVGAGGGADGQPKTVLKTERFDRDPGWEGFNNRVVLTKVPTVTQDFGHSLTAFASKDKGEVGGRVNRSTTPASYAARIAPKP